MRRLLKNWGRVLWPACLILLGCAPAGDLVVYTSQDEVFARPFLESYQKSNGLYLQALYDHESVKTVGLVRRLQAERENPRCDVFWSNEALRTYQLQAQGLLDPSLRVLEIGGRSRVFISRMDAFQEVERPSSLLDLTQDAWKGRVVMAFPMFGTTCTHMLALRHHLGREVWLRWCEGMLANDLKIVDGNSSVVRMVASGQADLGITDTDDVQSALREGRPIQSWSFRETLVIPNTVAVMHRAPHPEAARAFLEYMGTEAVLQSLQEAGAIQMSAPDEGLGLQVDWKQLEAGLSEGLEDLSHLFGGGGM